MDIRQQEEDKLFYTKELSNYMQVSDDNSAVAHESRNKLTEALLIDTGGANCNND